MKIEWQGRLDWDLYFQNYGEPGGADIVCVGNTLTERTIAELLVVLLLLLRNRDATVYHYVCIVLPPEAENKQAEIWRYFESTVERIRGFSIDEQERVVIAGRLSIHHSPTFELDSVGEILSAISANTFIYISEAARYRNSKNHLFKLSVTKTRLDEDVWAPHIRDLAITCTSPRLPSGVCVMIDTGELAPQRIENQNLLKSVDRCGVMVVSSFASKLEILSAISNGVSDVRAGLIERAMNRVDVLPADLGANLLLKVQILFKGEEFEKSVELLRELIAQSSKIDADVRVQLATIAISGNALDIAQQFLEETICEVLSLERLEQALSLCCELSLSELGDEYADRIAKFYPNSNGLQEYRFIKLYQACVDSVEWPNKLPSDLEFLKFRDWLVGKLYKKINPDYLAIMEFVAENWIEWMPDAALCCAGHAEALGDPLTVLVLVAPVKVPPRFSGFATAMLLRAIEKAIIGTGDESENEIIVTALQEVLRYLASHPNEAKIRVRLTQLFSFEVAATKGIAFLTCSLVTILCR